MTNQNANTFQSLLFQQIHFNQIKLKVTAKNVSNIHLQMFFQLYAIAAPVLESLFNKDSRFQSGKFIKKRLRDRCLFSCKSCDIFKNTYFGEHLRTTFAYQILHSVKQHCRICRRIQQNSKRKKFSLKVKVLNLNQLFTIIFTFVYIVL